MFFKFFLKTFANIKKVSLFCSMEIVLYNDRLVCQEANYLSKKEYARKYGITQTGLNYLKHKKAVVTLDVLGATFFKDEPPVKRRYIK